jgi:hypothetical protein
MVDMGVAANMDGMQAGLDKAARPPAHRTDGAARAGANANSATTAALRAAIALIIDVQPYKSTQW